MSFEEARKQAIERLKLAFARFMYVVSDPAFTTVETSDYEKARDALWAEVWMLRDLNKVSWEAERRQ